MSRTVILKNTTLSNKTYAGVLIPAASGSPLVYGENTIHHISTQFLHFETGLLADIASGDIIVNDGSIDLSPREGKSHLLHPFDDEDVIYFRSETSIVLPSGDTSGRPPSPEEGMFRYNSDLLRLERYVNDSWYPDVLTLDDLLDINYTGSPAPQDGDILVYNSGSPAGWGNSPSSYFNQNLWETISSDSGSTIADTPTDTLTISGGTGISTAISGDTLTINTNLVLSDIIDVYYTGSPTPQDGDLLVYNAGSPTGWTNQPQECGGATKVMNSWTLLSGTLYYNDFVHGYDTTEVAVFLRETSTDREIRAEYIEIIDANTIRVVVEGNAENITASVVTGCGPRGPTGAQGPAGADGGGATDIPSLTDVQITSLAANEVLVSTGGSPIAWENQTFDEAGIQPQFSIPSTDLTASGIIISATVDTNSTGVGAALYMASDGHFDEADADSTTTMPCRVLAVESGTGTKNVLLQGFLRKDAWNWTVGGDLYISTTTGALTQTAPSGSGDQVQKIGFAWTADIAYFSPGDYTIVEVA